MNVSHKNVKLKLKTTSEARQCSLLGYVTCNRVCVYESIDISFVRQEGSMGRFDDAKNPFSGEWKGLFLAHSGCCKQILRG